MRTWKSVWLGALFAVQGFAAELRVEPVGAEPAVFQAEALKHLPRLTVRAADHGGEVVSWSGVSLHQLLLCANVPFGQALRGQRLAQYALVTAADGYRAVFSLPELDPLSAAHPVLLADQMNGAPLPPEMGPFRLVLPGEKRHFRWVRQVVTITLLQAPER